jgi:hypothetical protein
LAERDDLRICRLVEPPAALDVLVPEVGEMRDRSTEGREPEPERDEKDLEQR